MNNKQRFFDPNAVLNFDDDDDDEEREEIETNIPDFGIRRKEEKQKEEVEEKA